MAPNSMCQHIGQVKRRFEGFGIHVEVRQTPGGQPANIVTNLRFDGSPYRAIGWVGGTNQSCFPP